MWAFNIRAFAVICAATAILIVALASGHAQDKPENYASWPVLKSTFPSTGGNGVMIKGYDPIITGKQCVTTFMAALPSGEVYFNVVEFESLAKAIQAHDGPEYQAALKVFDNCAERDLRIVEGLE